MEKIRLLPSGINDFERVRRDNLYYVDKTQFIATLEGGDSYVFFGRPRRFGKSLFVSMLEAYYDIKNKDRFDELFSGLWIHEHPTERRAFYQVLKLDFSQVDGKVEKVEEKFNEYCCVQLEKFAKKYADSYDDDYLEGLKKYDNASGRLTYVTSMARLKKKPEKTQEKFAEAKAQLEVYAADEKVKNFTENTTLHKIAMVFRGAEMELMEEVN